jgi:hypothetical protein
MRTTLWVVLLLALGGCSKALRIQFFNGTDKTFSVCSVGESNSECATVPAKSSAELQWKAGKFKLSTTGCELLYVLSAPEPLQDYAEIKDHAVKARVEPDWQLFVIPHRIDGFPIRVEQPQGYPAAPTTTQGLCK